MTTICLSCAGHCWGTQKKSKQTGQRKTGVSALCGKHQVEFIWTRNPIFVVQFVWWNGSFVQKKSYFFLKIRRELLCEESAVKERKGLFCFCFDIVFRPSSSSCRTPPPPLLGWRDGRGRSAFTLTKRTCLAARGCRGQIPLPTNILQYGSQQKDLWLLWRILNWDHFVFGHEHAKMHSVWHFTRVLPLLERLQCTMFCFPFQHAIYTQNRKSGLEDLTHFGGFSAISGEEVSFCFESDLLRNLLTSPGKLAVQWWWFHSCVFHRTRDQARNGECRVERNRKERKVNTIIRSLAILTGWCCHWNVRLVPPVPLWVYAANFAFWWTSATQWCCFFSFGCGFAQFFSGQKKKRRSVMQDGLVGGSAKNWLKYRQVHFIWTLNVGTEKEFPLPTAAEMFAKIAAPLTQDGPTKSTLVWEEGPNCSHVRIFAVEDHPPPNPCGHELIIWFTWSFDCGVFALRQRTCCSLSLLSLVQNYT